jgi:heme oxygenase
MEEMKAMCARPHARTQEAPFFLALMQGTLPLESYVGHLRALFVIHGVLEEALAESPEPRVQQVFQDAMRKIPLLEQDLRYFEPRGVADLREAVEAARVIDTRVRLRSLEDPLSLLGYLYVLEGSTLGARVLKPHLARTFSLTDDGGLDYVTSYGPEVEARFAEFKGRMNALMTSPEERARIGEAATDLFERLETVFAALYPFSPESRTFLVTSINPEAGRHAVPDDERELRAALRAGDCCWERFPYFEERYGERGRRFARSDGAWLATLPRLEIAQVLRQAQWLGRLLAARGMPTLLLETQLEILADELTAAIPEEAPQYEKLRAAAKDLRETRRLLLTESEGATLASEFEAAVGPAWNSRFPHAGSLLVCAVADELGGARAAVTSLVPWMSDAVRFTPDWVDAVHNTLRRARDIAATRGTGAAPADEGR